MAEIVYWGIAAIAAAAPAGCLAGIKNRDYSFWMAWCFILPPLVLFLFFLPRHKGPRPRRPGWDEEDKIVF